MDGLDRSYDKLGSSESISTDQLISDLNISKLLASKRNRSLCSPEKPRYAVACALTLCYAASYSCYLLPR